MSDTSKWSRISRNQWHLRHTEFWITGQRRSDKTVSYTLWKGPRLMRSSDDVAALREMAETGTATFRSDDDDWPMEIPKDEN